LAYNESTGLTPVSTWHADNLVTRLPTFAGKPPLRTTMQEEAMAIATTLKSYLDDHHVTYDMVEHAHSGTTLEAAHSAHVPGHQVAKAVVLEDEKGYVVSVVPSTNRLDLEWVRETLGRDLEMATEKELRALFQDCDLGAVPALSNAYGLDVVWDDQLKSVSDIYIEAGDHEHLVHIKGEDFRKLVEDMPHNIISAEKDYSRWMGA
jgi:Ala-tRNA(Pro) deacylase